MVTLEQVEKLKEYTNVSYEEAKAALENANGDILQAVIDLEKQGKINPPQGGGEYLSSKISLQSNTQKSESNDKGSENENTNSKEPSSCCNLAKRFLKWCGMMFRKGNNNYFLVEKNDERIMKIPVTILVILLIFAFWFVIPLLIIGLFFSFHYSFIGPDLGRYKVNEAMDSASKAAEDLKKDICK